MGITSRLKKLESIGPRLEKYGSTENVGGIPCSQACLIEALALWQKLNSNSVRGIVAKRIRDHLLEDAVCWRYHRERDLVDGRINEHGFAASPLSDWDAFPPGMTLAMAEELMKRILAGEV